MLKFGPSESWVSKKSVAWVVEARRVSTARQADLLPLGTVDLERSG